MKDAYSSIRFTQNGYGKNFDFFRDGNYGRIWFYYVGLRNLWYQNFLRIYKIQLEKPAKYYIWIDDVIIALYNYVGLLVNLGKCVKRYQKEEDTHEI